MDSKNKNFYGVIMAGGTGTRLWPLSRKQKPKQFQKFISDKTMIQETYDRISKVVATDNIMVSTAIQYKDLVMEQLPEIKERQLILEPSPRGTAAAIALVAKYISRINPNAVVATIASDHAIKNVDEFVLSVSAALQTAEKNPDKLVIMGINPTFADTALGYIKMGKEFSEEGGKKVFYADSFVEKPDKKTAEEYLSKWEYLWNAGYFIFSASSFLDTTKKFIPKVYSALEKIENEWEKVGLDNKEIEKLYNELENEPIDTAIAEKLSPDERLVVPSELQWSDVGTWSSLFDFFKGNEGSQMVVHGNHIDMGSSNCFVHAENKLIATVGLENIVIIDTDDAILIADKKNSGEVKKIIDKLKEDGNQLYL